MNKPATTKERLLDAACRIFAEKGYRDTTVAEICEAAGANIAAVNYHFSDKASLYYECFRHLFVAAQRSYPESDPESTDPEEWLRSFVRARILNILDTGEAGLLPRLLYKEMGQPSEIHLRLYNELIEPRRSTVMKMIRAFLGDGVEDEILPLAMINFTSLYIFMNVGKQRAREGERFGESHACGNLHPDRVAAQVEAFAMGGLRATRELLQTRKNML